MGGWPKLLLWPLLPLLLAAHDDPLTRGRQIYRNGIGQDPIAARQPALETAIEARDYACVRCHGVDGRGSREGGVTAPSLTVAQTKSEAEVDAWLLLALAQNRGADGHQLNGVMPNYTLSDRDRSALAAYLRTLPYPPEPGVTPQAIRLGLDPDGAGLDADAAARLRQLLTERTGALNRRGGIFGREILFVESDLTEVLITLGWAADSPKPGARFGVQSLHTRDGASKCGQLHPPLAEQIKWLQQKLTEEGQQIRMVELANADPTSDEASDTQAVIYAGDSAGLAAVVAANPPGRVYAFSDLAEAHVLSQIKPPPIVVMPIDIDAQIAQVQQLQRRQPTLASKPRAASMVLEMMRALEMVITALEQQGRQVSAPELCQRLDRLARQSWRFSLLPSRQSPSVVPSH